ncbi:HelD family protein [Alkalihalophilus marmarensis]|uniref:HelD family protein n=1 Tax=Alkalihalophilus marmarensis TaxID=521377 RepID=UPI002DBE485E|nr:UvrD-helicase domain-containing protein [Alkalihalophilus marmarensis]MEC2074057.1 AAA family ATPase [Alkalihalophilus marmarensis]
MIKFPDEIISLSTILTKLHKAYEKEAGKLENYQDEYKDLKQYMVDYRNEMDAMEAFSHQRSLTTIDKTGVMVEKKLDQLGKLIDSPYFGRIDFIYDGESAEDTEIFYIGKFSFTDEDGSICIYDWRAKVSGMYYEYELGPASYQSLNGLISGELTRKRQFKITNGELEYVLESSTNIHDDILQKELSTTADDRMKTIIATIQQEQNKIVRNEKAHTLVIQGVAGSGKTSIALHRIAYLLYKNKETLSSDRVMIVSPNKVFADYISTVLPELGEEPIKENTIEDIARSIMPAKFSFNTKYDQTKRLIEHHDPSFAERVSFKSSIEFFSLFNDYLTQLDTEIFEPTMVTIQEMEFTQDYLSRRFKSYSRYSVKKRIEYIARDILEVIKSKRMGEMKLPSMGEVTKRLKKRLRFNDPMQLYKSFYAYLNRTELFIMKKNQLEFADVYPYLYCIDYLEGIDTFNAVDHLVVDEMQDYTPVEYMVLQKIFPCKRTILGDFSQSLNPFALHTETTFKPIFSEPEFVELKKSYRSSYEIIEFTKQFLPENAIEAVKRHGDKPRIIAYHSDEEQIEELIASLHQFELSKFKTCGIICKTEAMVQTVVGVLREKFTFTRLDEDSSSFTEGITLTTVQLAKGLEFDQVVVPFVSGSAYRNEFEKGLLYVACTRAMHQLIVMQDAEDPSQLIIENQN